ncbi:MAG TPA: hypothetical protein VK763_16695 [Terriglobales bacterium]|nr:hypothetical protein [Terriglobales bacterium]
MKWRKYLALVDFGFQSADELATEIRRYPKSKVRRLVSDISSDIRHDSRRARRSLYVVKLVPADLQGQLPNFRVERSSQLKQLVAFLTAHSGETYLEAWYCRTRIDSEIFSVAGRIVFNAANTGGTQIIEQLWRGSPRLLETYCGDFEFPYVRASRYSWGWPYSIEHVHLPRKSALSNLQMQSEFGYSMRCIEQEREKIATFCAFLDSFSFKAYSLEYKIVASQLRIIDWDTPNDKRVLASRNVHLLDRMH